MRGRGTLGDPTIQAGGCSWPSATTHLGADGGLREGAGRTSLRHKDPTAIHRAAFTCLSSPDARATERALVETAAQSREGRRRPGGEVAERGRATDKAESCPTDRITVAAVGPGGGGEGGAGGRPVSCGARASPPGRAHPGSCPLRPPSSLSRPVGPGSHGCAPEPPHLARPPQEALHEEPPEQPPLVQADPQSHPPRGCSLKLASWAGL